MDGEIKLEKIKFKDNEHIICVSVSKDDVSNNYADTSTENFKRFMSLYIGEPNYIKYETEVQRDVAYEKSKFLLLNSGYTVIDIEITGKKDELI